MNAYQSKNQALVKISGFTMGEIGLASRLHRFAVLFTMLINVMLVHGYMPDDMLASVLVPIPKDPRASLTNSGNYRAIALYSSMGKIVDMLISDRYSNQLMTSNAQFAFKKCHSTSMCTALVKEVVSYYNGRNTNVS